MHLLVGFSLADIDKLLQNRRSRSVTSLCLQASNADFDRAQSHNS